MTGLQGRNQAADVSWMDAFVAEMAAAAGTTPAALAEPTLDGLVAAGLLVIIDWADDAEYTVAELMRLPGAALPEGDVAAAIAAGDAASQAQGRGAAVLPAAIAVDSALAPGGTRLLWIDTGSDAYGFCRVPAALHARWHDVVLTTRAWSKVVLAVTAANERPSQRILAAGPRGPGDDPGRRDLRPGPAGGMRTAPVSQPPVGRRLVRIALATGALTALVLALLNLVLFYQSPPDPDMFLLTVISVLALTLVGVMIMSAMAMVVALLVWPRAYRRLRPRLQPGPQGERAAITLTTGLTTWIATTLAAMVPQLRELGNLEPHDFLFLLLLPALATVIATGLTHRAFRDLAAASAGSAR